MPYDVSAIRGAWYNKLRQREIQQGILTGRGYNPALYEDILPAELASTYAAEASRSARAEDVAYRNEQTAMQREGIAASERGSMYQLGTTAALGTAYLTKDLWVPALQAKLGGGAPAAAPPLVAGSPEEAALIAGGAGQAAVTGTGVSTASFGPGSSAVGYAAGPWVGAAGYGAAAGYVGGQVAQPVGEAVGLGGKRERGAVGGALAGALAGAAATSWSGPGAIVGGIVGGIVGFASSGGVKCVLLSYLYGSESKEARTAMVFCAKHMDVPTLAGYYQLAKVLIGCCEKSPLFKKHLEKRVVRSFYRYMRYKLGKSEAISYSDRYVSLVILALCRMRYSMGHLMYFPGGAHICMARAGRG